MIPWWESPKRLFITTGPGIGIRGAGLLLFLDTHAVVFLHGGLLREFSPHGLSLLESETLFISPMVSLELQYLYEIHRIRYPARQILKDLKGDISLQILDRNWQTVIEVSWDQSWTRDPFDRMIAAQAVVEAQKLLTREELVQKNCVLALW